MKFDTLEHKLQSIGVNRIDGKNTEPMTYSVRKDRASLWSGANRLNSSWIRAELIIIDDASFKEKSETDCIEQWKIMNIRPDQMLLLKTDDESWNLYDNNGKHIGDESLFINKYETKADFIPKQTIYFGSPGTGKSFKIQDKILSGVDDSYIFRTTFHPDTDYASFVGCYKPTSTALKAVADTGATEEEVIEAFYQTILEGDKFKARYFAEAIYHAADIERLGLKSKDIVQKLESKGFDKCTYGGELSTIAEAISLLSNKLNKGLSNITYRFSPQTFTNAYVKAWQNPAENVYLVIEEINRGNCAQIFGDLFQLLDRNDDGISEYPIKADADLTKYLQEELGTNHEGIADGKIKLPANLYILATMNTSDQSLFPMDSAFKRRWEWKYVPTSVIGDKKKTLQVESKEETVLLNREQEKKVLRLGMYEYDWSVFLEKINKCITDATHSDDKQLGFWFVKTPKDSNLINIETFVSKVIFYLWTDVFKDFGAKATNPFAFKNAEGGWVVCPFSSFFDPYTGEINLGQIHGFMYNLGIIPELEPEIQDAIEKNIVEEGNPEA